MAVERYLHTQDLIAQDFVNSLQQVLDSPRDIQTLCYRYSIESKGIAGRIL
jgi:hypothetical protein